MVFYKDRTQVIIVILINIWSITFTGRRLRWLYVVIINKRFWRVCRGSGEMLIRREQLRADLVAGSNPLRTPSGWNWRAPGTNGASATDFRSGRSFRVEPHASQTLLRPLFNDNNYTTSCVRRKPATVVVVIVLTGIQSTRPESLKTFPMSSLIDAQDHKQIFIFYLRNGDA